MSPSAVLTTPPTAPTTVLTIGVSLPPEELWPDVSDVLFVPESSVPEPLCVSELACVPVPAWVPVWPGVFAALAVAEPVPPFEGALPAVLDPIDAPAPSPAMADAPPGVADPELVEEGPFPLLAAEAVPVVPVFVSPAAN